MKCRNIFLGTAFINYPFLWNTAGFICFKKPTGNTRFQRIAGWLLYVFALSLDIKRQSCSELQGFALLKEFISERLEIKCIVSCIQEVFAP